MAYNVCTPALSNTLFKRQIASRPISTTRLSVYTRDFIRPTAPRRQSERARWSIVRDAGRGTRYV
eukprot:3923135-Lingulodinium_polyedra.AAC.1